MPAVECGRIRHARRGRTAMARDGDVDEDLNEDADEAEKARKDPEESLHNAPSEGSTIRDFFSFEEIFARVTCSW